MTTARQFLSLPIAEIGELGDDDYVGLIDETAVECLKVRLAIEGPGERLCYEAHASHYLSLLTPKDRHRFLLDALAGELAK